MVILAVVSGCGTVRCVERTATVHLFDKPQNPGGFASGVDPDSIRVLIGSTIVPREQIGVARITDPKLQRDPGSPGEEYLVTFDPQPNTSAFGDTYVFFEDHAGNLGVLERVWSASGDEPPWQFLPAGEAERLKAKHFPPVPRARREWPAHSRIDAPICYLFERDGNVWCEFPDHHHRPFFQSASPPEGSPAQWAFRVDGPRLNELKALGLAAVAGVKATVEGGLGEERRIDIRHYRIITIYPKK